MPATLVQTKTGSTALNSTALALALASNTGTGDTVIVAVFLDDTVDDVSSVTATGMTFTKITAASGLDGAGNGYLSIWYAFNVTGATTPTISVNKSKSMTMEAVCFHYSGLTTTNPLDKTATATGSSNAPASGSTAALSQANEVVVGIFGSESGGATYTVGSGYGNLKQVTANGNSEMAMQDKQVAATTAVSSAATLSASTGWRASVLTFLIASSGTAITCDSYFPSSFLGTIKSDSLLRYESISNTKSDSFTPDESIISVKYDGYVPDETFSAQRSDQVLCLESVGNIKADLLNSLESLVTQRSDISSPLENTGITQITMDGFLPLEIKASQQADQRILFENITGIKADTYAVAESISTQKSDFNLPIEVVNGIKSDSLLRLESISNLVANQNIQLESLALLIRNNYVPLESLSITRFDGNTVVESLVLLRSNSYSPLENISSFQITIDGFLPLEFTALQKSDANISMETAINVKTDSLLLSENIVSIKFDSNIRQDFLSSIQGNAFIAGEIMALQFRDIRLPVEYIALASIVITNSFMPLEFAGSIRGDTKLPVEFRNTKITIGAIILTDAEKYNVALTDSPKYSVTISDSAKYHLTIQDS